MLYALGIGLSHEPTDRDELRFTYEKELRVLPTFPVVLCRPGDWYKRPDLGIDWVRMLHGEQSVEVTGSLPVAATVIGRNKVMRVVDKGEGRGALVFLGREIVEKASGNLLATLGQTLFLRGGGGFGGPAVTVPKPHVIPGRRQDITAETIIDRRAALIYRLSGDYNEIHADPELATKAGFDRPIFHGLGSFGMVAFEVLKYVCNCDVGKMCSIGARFSAPVYPGEVLRTEIWVDGDQVSFRASVVERGTTVLDNGMAKIVP
jgi:acyl dehydratase